MKFFSKKDSQKNENTNENIIDVTPVNKESTETKEVNIAKIDPIKVTEAEAIKGTTTAENKNEAEGNNNTNKSEFEQKVDKVISSVAQLFAPFKELMIKIVPQSKGVIKLLDYLAKAIAYLTKLVVLRYPSFIKFLKSFYFKIIVIFLVFMFIFGAIFSKIINSDYYVNSIENAIYKSTGYKAKINGRLRVTFIPSLSVTLSNVTFFTEDTLNSSDDKFKVNQFDAANLKIDFKFFPLFIGNFSIKNVELIGATLNLQTADATTLPDKNYDKIISDVEESIKSTISNEKIQEIEAKSKTQETKKPSDPLNDEVSDILNNLDSLVNSDNLANKKQVPAVNTKNDNTPKASSNSNDVKQEQSQVQEQAPKSNTPINSEEFNKDQTGSLISPKEDTSAKYSFLSTFLSKIVNNINFSFNDVDNFSLRRGRINIIDNQGSKLLFLENIHASVTSSLMGKITSEGGFRFTDSNIDYKSTISYKKDKVNFDINFILDSNSADLIKVKGYKDQKTGDILADLSVENKGILVFINKFLFEIDSKKIKNSSFNAKLLLNSNFIKIENINMALNNDIYKGSFIWDFSSISKNVIIDLTAKMNDMHQITQGINSTLNASIIKDSSFLAAIEEITNWKNAKINLFKPNHFVVNFKVEDTLINNIKVDSLNVGFLINDFDKLYIYDLSAKTKDYNAKAVGRVDLDSKTALFSVESQGQISSSSKTLGFSPKTIEFLQNVGKNKDNYNISTKIRLENNKLLFTDFTGSLGDLKLSDTYIIYTQRIEDSDVLISTKIPELNLENIQDIYNKQISGLTYEKIEDVNIFGLPDNLKIKINIDIAKSKIKGVPFKDANLDISLFKTGFTINKFSALGEKGGSLTASLSADSIVLPVIAGHVNLDDLVLRFEDSKDLFFSKTPIIGNVVLNGKIKFSGDSFTEPLSTIDGEISFIKQERIEVNRFANIDGLFLTLSNKKLKGIDTIYVNDIYGRADIKNNIIELYPIAMLYIKNNKEYRGISKAIIDLKEGKIQGDGTGEMTLDTRNKLKFDLSGSFLNPNINASFFKGQRSSVGVKPVEKDITLINKKTHRVVNKLNDTKDKNNFNNTYNSNIANKSYDKLKNQLYDDLLDDNTKGKTTYPSPQTRKPSNGAITKNKDNTLYYGNNK